MTQESLGNQDLSDIPYARSRLTMNRELSFFVMRRLYDIVIQLSEGSSRGIELDLKLHYRRVSFEAQSCQTDLQRVAGQPVVKRKKNQRDT